jgi:uncharacterized RDD family membrane protein YckC
MFDLEGVIAPFGKRTCAFLIDAGVTLLIMLLIWMIIGGWFVLFALVYLLVRDGAHGQSVGKRVMDLQVVDHNTAQPCNLPQSVLRNVPIALVIFCPVELVVAAMSPESFRVGDYLAGTLVIEKKKGEGREPSGVDLSHPTEGLERLSEITGMDIDSSLNWGASDDSLAALQAAGGRMKPEPHLTLQVSEQANADAVDEAYWSFMNRFSDDAVRDLSSEELDQRCRELIVRFQHLDMAQLGITIEYSRKLSDREKRDLIYQHVTAVSTARDALLR